MLPRYLRSFFWDINLDHFDPQSYPEHTIARILEYGDDKAVAWLKKTFSEKVIKAVLRKECRLSRKSAIFWALIYNIPSGEIAALK